MSVLRRFTCALVLLACGSSHVFADTTGCVPPTIHNDPVAIIVACDAALSASGLSDEERAALLLTRGRGYKASGRLIEATTDFDAGLALTPDNFSLRMFRGWVAYDKRDFEDLDRILADLIRRYPSEADVYDLIGTAAVMRKDWPAARQAYDRALALKPEHVIAREHRGHLFWRLRDYEAALKDFAVLADSKHPDVDLRYSDFFGRKISYRTLARLNSVKILEDMGHTERAEKGFEEFARIEPGPVSYGWWGLFHHRRAQFERAQGELEKALSYAPEFWYLHALIGSNLSFMEKHSQALESLDRAVALNPKSGWSRWLRAQTLRRLHRMDEAIDAATLALEVDPPFLKTVAPRLLQFGYLQVGPNEPKLSPMVRDAATACMLDEKCW